MSAVATDPRNTEPRKSPFWASRSFIFVTGVFVIPLVLGLAFNSWGPLTAESAIVMAFATVAAHTIAIATTVVVFVLSVVRRSAGVSLAFTFLAAAFVVLAAMSNLSTERDLLQHRLELVATVDQLNR
jgi:hypothetical protein